jgi:hypothetical protein
MALPVEGSTAVIAMRPARRPIVLLSACGVGLALLFFVLTVREGINTLEFTDEWEQFVAAQMLIQGQHLYKDVFSHHGPVPYMIAHLYTRLAPDWDFSYIRLSHAMVALAAWISLMLSPALRTLKSRLWSGALYLLLLSSVWNIGGFNVFHYAALSGPLFVIVIAQVVVPVLLHRRPASAGLVASGSAAVLACFCAYSNGPAMVLLMLAPLIVLCASADRGPLYAAAKPFVWGALIAAFAVAMWLWRFGDLGGFFVYHLYFNQQIYSPYVGLSGASILRNFSFALQPSALVHSLALALFAGWGYLAVIAAKGPSLSTASQRVALVLVAIAVVLMNPRGATQGVLDCSFVTANFALFAIAGGLVLETISSPRRLLHATVLSVGLVFVATQVGRYATLFGIRQGEMARYASPMKPERSPIYDFIRSITKYDGDFLALNGNAIVYTKLGRLPASGNLFYFPWQADYNREPKFGYKIDTCADIETRKPAVIWFFNWRVLDSYALDDYEPCILSLISARYRPLRFASPWLIRDDLWPTVIAGAPSNAPLELELVYSLFMPARPILRPSVRLSRYSPIRIMMTPDRSKRAAALSRIGVLLGTHGERNQGTGELRLHDSGGREHRQRFSLHELEDNSYHFFDVEQSRYTSAELVSVEGGGISTWEGEVGKQYSTCLIYEYADGTRAFTPSCPLR